LGGAEGDGGDRRTLVPLDQQPRHGRQERVEVDGEGGIDHW
jgi:hypothetical protein